VINLVIDEMMFVKYCGCVDIVVNGIYWGGVIFGMFGMFILFN